MILRTIRYPLLLAMIYVISAGAPKAQTVSGVASLDGIWIINKEKSDTGWRFTSGFWVWTIKVADNKITITQDYPPQSTYQDCEIVLYSDDRGETNPNCFEEAPPEAESKTIWKKDKLVREYQTTGIVKGTIYKRKIQESFSISKSGRLVLERREYADPHLFSASQEKISTTYDVIRKFVFDKKN